MELTAAVMLHVDLMFLYISGGGQHDDRDFHASGGGHSQTAAMRRSLDEHWMRRSDPPRDGHRASSFERFPRPSSPWQSRPRSPPRARSPLCPKRPPNLLTMGTVSDPFDANVRLRSTLGDRRPPSDSFHAGARTVDDATPRQTQLTQSADSWYQTSRVPEKHRPYKNYDKVPHDVRSGPGDVNQQRHFAQPTPNEEQHRGKWSNVQQSADGNGRQKKITTGQSVRNASLLVKKSDAVSASRKHVVAAKVRSVPSKPTATSQAANAGDQAFADTSAAAESAVPIRPEDIIIIRRYNLDGSAAEKKPEETEQHTKRHVVRLVRNNVVAIGGSGVNANASVDRTESGTDTGRQKVVKKRSWSGLVKTAHVAETGEGGTGIGGVDEARLEHSIRSADNAVDNITCNCFGLTQL